MRNNKPTKVFDNIGFYCRSDKQYIVADKVIKNYSLLDSSHVGYYIPYLCRNIKNNLLEIGVGFTKLNENGDIIIERHELVSSKDNKFIDFPSDSEFYIFANEKIFDKSITNVIVIDDDKILDNISSIYLVDCTNKDINITLPKLSDSTNLILEFKHISKNNSVIIKDGNNNEIISNLQYYNPYTKIVSSEKTWKILTNDTLTPPPDDKKYESLSADFAALADPAGNEKSLQYKNGSSFLGSQAYWDNLNNRLLLGADTASAAHTVIPASGDYPLLINQSKNNNDFIVYGSGNRNLFFSYDGRLGLNIPSGSRPSTIFHVVNTICQEGFRLENRSLCHPANITLYHKPVAAINNGSVVGQINLSGKDSQGNRTDYSVIESVAVNTVPATIDGGLQIRIASPNTAGSGIKVFETNNTSTKIGYSGAILSLDKAGSISLKNNNTAINLTSTTVGITGALLSLNGATVSIGNNISSNTTINGAVNITNELGVAAVRSNNVFVPSIGSGSFLTIGSGNRLIGHPTMSTNNIGTINLPIPPDKLLQTTSGGAVTGIYSTTDYFRTDGDISWNKFTKRLASACLKQITLNTPAPIEEFVQGDQLAIISSDTTIYRRIVSVDIANNLVVGLLVDQNVSTTDIGNITIYSITRGGYLAMSMSTVNGISSSSTSNTISLREGVDTNFNLAQQNINFSIYGIDKVPAFKIKANSGRISIISGVYNSFATNSPLPAFPIVVTTGGVGISNLYASANFAYDSSRNLFSGIVSDVGTNGMSSYYGTYDQNGNVSEWIEQPNISEFLSDNEFVAGGSHSTNPPTEIGASGLKHMELLPRSGGYDNVGFRVAGLYNAIDPVSISDSSQLNMVFVGVIDPNNSEDNSTTYIKQDGIYNSIVLNNLGVVDSMYRIGKYEVTNAQYCRFLNATATTHQRGLYDSRMQSSHIGGINCIFNEVFLYSVKPSMANKPVVFVNYISAIRFINWLHNGANNNFDNESDIDYALDLGAYTIVPIGTNSFNIVKSNYAKYWLPNRDQWHKAAYFKPVDINAFNGTSSVMIKRDDPFLVGSGIEVSTNSFKELYANLSVSGWLYVDHLIVGDGTIRSARRFTGLKTDQTTTPPPTVQEDNTNTVLPPTNLEDIINRDPNSSTTPTGATSAGTNLDNRPGRLTEDTGDLCNDPDLIEQSNIPWFCSANNSGPGFF